MSVGDLVLTIKAFLKIIFKVSQSMMYYQSVEIALHAHILIDYNVPDSVRKGIG